MIGQQLHNRYLIKALLGKKTGRRTFLAEDSQTGKRVVVKLVLFGPDFVWDDIKLFEREAQTLKSLEHSAIPKYLDSFEVETPLGNGFALVQTYIDASSLQVWMERGYRFSQMDLEAIALQTLPILDYLHQHNPPIIHRDIKPSNILLMDQGDQTPSTVYLIDFGSVQTIPTSGTMTVVGTYGYMPPEQFGGRAKPASDLYSLGATLIYLATGQHPADLTQDDLRLVFTPQVILTEHFTQWLAQLTQASLAKRTASAAQAIWNLTHPQPMSPFVASPPEPMLAPVAPAKLSSLPSQLYHKDFRIHLNAREMEIRFLPSRLDRYNPIASFLSGLVQSGFWGGVFLFVLSIGNLPLLLVTLVSFVLWASIYAPRKRRRTLNNPETASIKLYASPKGLVRMSLSSKHRNNRPNASAQHLLDLPLREVSYSSFGNQVAFLYNNADNTAPAGKFGLYGNKEDLDWLCDALARCNISIKGNFRRFPQGDR